MLRNLDNKGGPTISPQIGHVIGAVFTIALPTPMTLWLAITKLPNFPIRNGKTRQAHTLSCQSQGLWSLGTLQMVGAFTSSEELILLGRMLFQLHDRRDSWTDGAMKRFSEKYYSCIGICPWSNFILDCKRATMWYLIRSTVLREYACYQSQLHTRDDAPEYIVGATAEDVLTYHTPYTDLLPDPVRPVFFNHQHHTLSFSFCCTESPQLRPYGVWHTW